MPAEWIIAIIALVSTGAWSLFVFIRTRPEQSSGPKQVRHITVNGSCRPSAVHVNPGQPTRLIFRREDTAPRSKRIVLPDYGIRVQLAAFEEVVVDLPPSDPGEHEFTCQMETFRGTLIVDDSSPAEQRGREAVAQ
jgi:plastocyanin domain-containing protein